MQHRFDTLDDNQHWYKDAVIYELHIKAFMDSNGDGIGDFEGLMTRLDYLQELGVTAIWLLPFYPSPLKDDGYDIADYYTINPTYGNLEQFRRFLDEAHKRNLKVITELVINHTSDQHPWFQRARLSPPGSPEREFYVWTDDPQQYKDVRIIFQDFEASNWSWDPVAGQYYWHRFFHHQPDLNYDNPQVQQEIFNILDYWCEMGVDGFRLDAVPYLYEREGTNGENLPETHAFLKKLRAHIDEKYPGTVFLAEANMWPEDSASYFGDGDECHMNYHFPVMPRMFMALQREDRYPITDIFDQTPEIPPTCQWAMFLRNHDELTLEMVTDEERDYMYRVYAKDPKARINLGIRHRLAPLMDNDRRKIELMNSLLFSLPGTPVIYYGDEIGMGDNFYLGDRNGVRTPMQWSPDRNAGFSAANPHSLYLPVIMDPEYNYEAVNVELQRRNTSSLFWYMKRIINMRKKYKAFGRGDMKFIHVDNPKVLAFTRTYEEETLLIVVNLSKYAQAAEVSLPQFKGYVPMEAFSRNAFPAISEERPYFFTLGAHSFQWFELQASEKKVVREGHLPLVQIHTLTDFFTGSQRQVLESELLFNYLPSMHWFTAKDKQVHHIRITDYQPLQVKECKVVLALVEVNFESGLPETYVLPITWLTEAAARLVKDSHPEAIIASVTQKGEKGWICDAYYTTEMQQWLFEQLVNSEVMSLTSSVLHFKTLPSVRKEAGSEEIRPRVQDGQQNNTSITYNNRFFLKLYRKVDQEIHPDIEVSRYLTEETQFRYTPAFLGNIDWMLENGNIALGMFQQMVENHGDGRSYMLERLNNYIERILAREHPVLIEETYHESLLEPVSYESLPQDLQALLGGPAAEQSRLLGKRLAALHLALAEGKNNKAFQGEDFSLHYQRSLFSSMQSLVRETFQNIEKKQSLLEPTEQLELEQLKWRKEELLNELKKIYHHKIDAEKIRIHGNLHLQQVLLTGKDLAIHDFGGNPNRNHSERRLRRSPLRDVASMIRSFYYVGHKAFFQTTQVERDKIPGLLPYAALWAQFMSNFFLQSYLEHASGGSFIPANRDDLQLLLKTFLLEGAVHDLNFELNNRQEFVIVPLRLIDAIMNIHPTWVQKKSLR